MTHWLRDDENTVPISSSSSEGSAILGMDTENCVHQQWGPSSLPPLRIKVSDLQSHTLVWCPPLSSNLQLEINEKVFCSDVDHCNSINMTKSLIEDVNVLCAETLGFWLGHLVSHLQIYTAISITSLSLVTDRNSAVTAAKRVITHSDSLQIPRATDSFFSRKHHSSCLLFWSLSH